MFRRIIVLSALAAGLSSFGAHASVPAAGEDIRPAARQPTQHVQLAQNGDVEIYYDEFGRRIVVDAYTGEVLSVERPRRGERRIRREAMRERGDVRRGDQERYYLDDPNDVERLRRQKLQDAGIIPAPPVDGYENYSRRGLPGGIEDYPEAPRRAFPDEPEIIAREPAPGSIERLPLDNPEGESDTSAMAEAPAPGTPNIVEGAIDPSLSLGARDEVAALQILLDRRGASPGVIDGRFGSNVDKAIVAYRSINSDNLKSTDSEGIKKALAASGGDPFVNYTLTAADVAGSFVASIPADYGEKAKLEKLSYTSVTEMLAERFHMDEGYLKALNPGRQLQPRRARSSGSPMSVSRRRARLPASSPTRPGSRSSPMMPTTSSSWPIRRRSARPTRPRRPARIWSRASCSTPTIPTIPNINFKQGENNEILTIPPGPNGPVGSVWIALDKPTYGVHGTPDPSKIGKTESHGCVRLTNWDAQELAKLVKAGVPVEFVD